MLSLSLNEEPLELTSSDSCPSQLSKQASINSFAEKRDPEKTNEQTTLIVQEEVKTGSVSGCGSTCSVCGWNTFK